MGQRYGAAPDLRTEEFSRELAKFHFLNGLKPFPVTIVESGSK